MTPNQKRLVNRMYDGNPTVNAHVIREFERLNAWVADLMSGCQVNCVYCGHRYGPDDGTTPVSMADVLKQHVMTCPEHPMNELRMRLEELEKKGPGGP